VLKQSESDRVTIVGGGVTVHEAMAAAAELAGSGVNVRVIDPFTVKPIDKEGLLAAVRATSGKLIVVEDHYPEGKFNTPLPLLLSVLILDSL